MSSKPNRSNCTKNQQGLMLVGFIIVVLIITLIVFLAMYTYKLNDEIIDKFESRRWDIPATIYSRPLEISANSSISPENLEYWLTSLHYEKGHTNNTGSYTKSGNTYTIYTRGFNYGDGDVDAKQILKIEYQGNKISHLQSTEKSSSGIIRLEPINIGGIYPENNEDRILLTKETVPKPLINALIATEDRNFYQHHGISIRGTMRALFSNLKGGSTQGGSTITQQLIKNFYLSSERTFKRKINEAIMALLLERHYTKDDILLAYLNEINLGQNGNRSVNGFGVASEFYFNKPLSELRLDQYALLVGLAKGPSYYNPKKHAERALARRNTVLENMLNQNKISQEDFLAAKDLPLKIAQNPSIAKSAFPDFFDVVHRELKKYYKESDLRRAGLKIISTLDPIAQHSANQAIKNKLTTLKKSNQHTALLESALVSADVKTGELVAIVGGSNEFTEFNRAIDAKRQVGSLLKPVIYLTALQSGTYNLASSVKDEAISYQAGKSEWTPKNYNGRSHGDVPLMTALANSYNQAAVNVGMEFGLNTFQKQMHQLGITGNLSSYPSVLLGAVDLSPMQMLGVYQIFASGGYHTPIHSIRTVISEKGDVLQRNQNSIQTTPRIPPEAMYLANFATAKVITEGTAKDALALGDNLNLIGKTGTTNDARDAWFAGFSGNYVSVVWVGRDDNKPFGLTGGKGALPIWIDYMRRLSLTPVHFDTPDKITEVWLENGTGKLTQEYCPNAIKVPVITEFMPKERSDCYAGDNTGSTPRKPKFDDVGTDDKAQTPSDFVVDDSEEDFVFENDTPVDTNASENSSPADTVEF